MIPNEGLQNIAAYIFDPELRYQFAAGHEIEKHGYDPEVLIGMRFGDAFQNLPSELFLKLEMHYLKVLGGEMDYIVFKHKGEQYGQYGFPFFWKGQILGGITISISFQKSIQRKKSLQKINKMLIDALHQLAHDVRGPLATSLGLIQVHKMEKERTMWQKVKDFLWGKRGLKSDFVVEAIYNRLLVLDMKVRAINGHIEDIENETKEKDNQ